MIKTFLDQKNFLITKNHNQNFVQWEIAIILIPCVFISSIFGAKLNKITHEKITLFSVGVSALMISGYFFYKSYNKKW